MRRCSLFDSNKLDFNGPCVFEKPPEVRAERSTLVIGRKSLRNSEGKIVLTVVYFHEGETRLGNAQPPRSPEDAVADIHGVVSSFEGLQSRVKTELRDATFLLDLAVRQTRRLIKAIRDPAMKKLLDDDLMIIEELLQLARHKTLGF
jgi:hypothetical protein